MLLEYSLAGTWKAKDKESAESGYEEAGYPDSRWDDIKVPSHWQRYSSYSLFSGTLVYRKRFTIPERFLKHRTRLLFKGVFYYAKAWLNGVLLGEHEGYFHPFSFDVTELLRKGKDNMLVVEVSCPNEADLKHKRLITGVFSHWDMKSKESNPGGIWQDVSLICTEEAYIEKASVVTYLRDKSADADFRLAVHSHAKANADIEITVSPKNFKGHSIRFHFETRLGEGINSLDLRAAIPNPQLWWTWDHGKQNMYTANIKVVLGKRLSDAKTISFGIKEVSFKNWTYRLNGHRIFIRGTNYAPAKIRIAEATREFYEHDIDMIRKANINAVRVHAHVEKEDFYDICSENGILVWQDFPLQWNYSKEVESQAVAQVKQMVDHLGNYPCIGIWCCHNEPWGIESTQKNFDNALSLISPFKWNSMVLDTKLSNAIKDRTPIPIVIHSGVVGFFRKGTDTHHYFGWFFLDYRALELIIKLKSGMARFVTEYGAQSIPLSKKFKFSWPIDWDLLNNRYACTPAQMRKYIPPEKYQNLKDYALATQDYQAEFIKFYTEVWRKHKFTPTGGCFHFIFNDAFPATTWSVVDYYREPKRAYKALMEVFEPIYIMMDWPRKEYRPGQQYSTNIYAINDQYVTLRQIPITAEILHGDEVIIKHSYTVDLEENCLRKVRNMRFTIPSNVTGDCRLRLRMVLPYKTVENVYVLKVRV